MGTTPQDRRTFLRNGMLGAMGLAMAGPSAVWAARAKVQAKAAPPKARAKTIIQIWMWGGPSHLDTFDPKPQAGYDYCGPFTETVATNADGMVISAQLPLLAKQADKYSIIRSTTHGINGHETASYMVQSGQKPGRIVRPSLGAIVSVFKGYEQGYKGIVPPYIVLTQAQGRFSEAGFLGSKYKPFATGGDPARNPFAVEGIVARGISDERQVKRRSLAQTLDSLGEAMPDDKTFALFNQREIEAYQLMFGDTRKLFDLTTETDQVREHYGQNTFGQSCLMARRLVEEGVPYITINYKGWDTHKQHFQIMGRKLPNFDRGLSALLQDLAQRGLLDSTIIWCGGEFGRTPKVKWEAPWNGGRSHHGACFSTLVAGGGFKAGHVLGASDAHGVKVRDRPVYPSQLTRGMCELMGIDPDGMLPNFRGLDVAVMPAGEKGGRLSELI